MFARHDNDLVNLEIKEDTVFFFFYKCFRLSALALIRARSRRANKATEMESQVEVRSQALAPAVLPHRT